ncbi:hypothetical protein GDO81_008866 [Engystomops pustulosus]|uniref:Ig-like domain-containing protein n=1 Tax=Engystomops pustulosus TaxID=76066 RepID=A0AAV7BMU2_ENGPU|nr:hypothetical protein GDO81_008866 [Engystomops pustulosus]
MRLSLLLFFCLHGICWTKYTCVYQPKVLYVKEGESVTIPCSYTYPDYYRRKSQIIVTWGKAEGRYCSKITKNITDPSGNIVDDEYKDRISVVNNPENRTGSITIRGLKATDGVTFCCIETIYTTTSKAFSWFDIYGTTLTFADGKSLSQVEELIAVPGEEMVVPCHHPLKPPEKVIEVSWNSGDDVCRYTEDYRIYTWPQTFPEDGSLYSMVNFPEDVSLRIHGVRRNEHRSFCCRVTYSNGQYTESRFGTELTIAGPPSSGPFNVTQSYNITGHRGESVTLSCSYSPYMESDVLGVDIYWRAGNISGPYVYHPYKEMVHPNYRGRTGIIRVADLHIQGLEMSDASMYYCFVMIRWCRETGKHQKRIQYGGGTRLMVTASTDDKTESHLDPSVVIIASYLSFKFFFPLALFILVKIWYRNVTE